MIVTKPVLHPGRGGPLAWLLLSYGVLLAGMNNLTRGKKLPFAPPKRDKPPMAPCSGFKVDVHVFLSEVFVNSCRSLLAFVRHLRVYTLSLYSHLHTLFSSSFLIRHFLYLAYLCFRFFFPDLLASRGTSYTFHSLPPSPTRQSMDAGRSLPASTPSSYSLSVSESSDGDDPPLSYGADAPSAISVEPSARGSTFWRGSGSSSRAYFLLCLGEANICNVSLQV